MIKNFYYDKLKQKFNDIKPFYCIEKYFDCLYLSHKNIVIFFDNNDDKNYKNNCLIQNKYFFDKGIKVFRVRDIKCELLFDTSKDIILSNIEDIEKVKLSLEKFYGIAFDENLNIDNIFYNELYEIDKKQYNDFIDKMCHIYVENTKLPFIHIDEIYNNYAIGEWYNKQNKKIVKVINGIEYEIDSTIDNWHKYLSICKYLINIFKNVNSIPYYYIYEKYNIGSWLSVQRNEYMEKTINRDRIKELEDIGFIWNKFTNQWDETFDLVKEWCETNDTKTIPKNTIYKGVRIGYWLQTQRKELNKGEIYPERLYKLQSYGFSMKNMKEEKWEENYNLLLEYIKEFGNSNISKRTIYKDKKLGQWLFCQKRSYKDKTMSKEHYDKLKEYLIL